MLRSLLVAVSAAACALLQAGVAAAQSAAPASSARPASSAPRARSIHSYSDVTISPTGDAVLAMETTQGAPGDREAPGAIVVRWVRGARKQSFGCGSASPRWCRVSSPAWSPGGTRIAFVRRDLKARTSDLDVVDVRPGVVRAPQTLAHFAGLLNGLRWSPDGRTIAVLATAAAHKEIGATQAGASLTGDIGAAMTADVQRIAVVAPGVPPRFVSPPDLFIYEYDWTADGRGFAATGAHGNGDNSWWVARLYAIDAAKASAREILTKPGLQITQPRVSPDGKNVAFIAGLMSDFGSVGGDVHVVKFAAPMDVYNMAGNDVDITSGMPASATSIGWNGRSDRVTFTALRGEKSTVETVDVTTRRIETLWAGTERISAGGGMRVSFALNGTTSGVVHEDFEHPPEIAVGPVGGWTNLTHENAAVAPVVRAQNVTWTDDGFNVQGWLLEPRRILEGRKYPLIVEVHGGPSAAVTPSFVGRGTVRDLIERGYFVFEPNPRGSFGQGEAFTAANVRDFGGGDLRDILSGVDAVERVAPVDDAKLGIFGHSYGGYMTMWAVTQTHRFKAAVAGAGIANWQSYYGENGIDEWMIPFFGASVYDDPAVYAKSAPITFIKNVTTPTFAYVGERDVECPAPQSLEFWHALQTLHVPSDLVIYAGEGHGIRDRRHQRDLTQRTLAWFDRYLK